jgi:hypothetical protein
MAYNLMQLLRMRHLRERSADGRHRAPHSWRRLFEWARDALRLPLVIATDV